MRDIKLASPAIEVKDLQEGKLYMIRDAETGFTCTNYTFSKEGQGKGQIAKWYYSTYENYPEGAYMRTVETVQEQLKYLQYMNDYLGQNKRFEIFEVDTTNIIFSTKHNWEELNVTKYHKANHTFVIQDEETGNYVSSDSVFIGNKQIYYVTHTGRADGLEYNKNYNNATKIADRIQNLLAKHNIHKSFQVIEVNKEDLAKGQMVIKTLAACKTKCM